MKFLNVKEINEHFHEKDLLKVIEEKGKEKIKFLVPMTKVTDFGFIRTTSSSDTKDLVICSINEKRFKVEDEYKITLEAENYDFYGYKHYYTSDLAKLIKEGMIKIIL